jgi:hypothetical protein
MHRRISHNFTRVSFAAVLFGSGGFAAMGCGAAPDGEQSVESTSDALVGDALPGTNSAAFTTARSNFGAVENAADGLGPIMNANACGTCHQNGALGGAGQQVESRYGTLINGVFNGLASTGGSLRQLFGLGGFNVGGLNCNSGTDATEAPGATIFAGRLTTPLFGLRIPRSICSRAVKRRPSVASSTASRSRCPTRSIRASMSEPCASRASVGRRMCRASRNSPRTLT